MPAIFAQVDGDAVGAAALRRQRRLDDVRVRRPARLPDRGDVVDVDAEADHGGDVSARAPSAPVSPFDDRVDDPAALAHWRTGSLRTPLTSPDVLAQRGRDLLAVALDLRDLLALDHDADERFGARVAHQHAAARRRGRG